MGDCPVSFGRRSRTECIECRESLPCNAGFLCRVRLLRLPSAKKLTEGKELHREVAMTTTMNYLTGNLVAEAFPETARVLCGVSKDEFASEPELEILAIRGGLFAAAIELGHEKRVQHILRNSRLTSKDIQDQMVRICKKEMERYKYPRIVRLLLADSRLNRAAIPQQLTSKEFWDEMHRICRGKYGRNYDMVRLFLADSKFIEAERVPNVALFAEVMAEGTYEKILFSREKTLHLGKYPAHIVAVLLENPLVVPHMRDVWSAAFESYGGCRARDGNIVRHPLDTLRLLLKHPKLTMRKKSCKIIRKTVTYFLENLNDWLSHMCRIEVDIEDVFSYSEDAGINLDTDSDEYIRIMLVDRYGGYAHSFTDFEELDAILKEDGRFPDPA